MHILFRPSGTPNLSDRRVALFKNQFNISTAITPEEISKITKSQIVWFTSIKEHDQEMAVQQALLHRTLLTLGELISKGTGRTYISQKILELCDRIKAGDSELYEFIQQNRHVSDALKDFSDNLKNFDIHKFFPL
jgi:prephenate dehydrogenase